LFAKSSAMSLTQQLTMLPEPLFSRFVLQHKLGQGSFGVVYQICERGTGQLFALKVVDKAPLVARQVLDALHKEVSILKMYPGRHHIVQLHEFFEVAGRFFLVFDCCEHDLEAAVSGCPFDEEVAFDWLRQACEGVSVLHAGGVIHRDLKPANFLVDDKGLLQICDFGLACHESDGACDLAGTPGYAAPEVLSRQKAQTVKADVYSLGACLQHFLLGRQPQGPADLPSQASDRARQLLAEMMHSDPEARPSVFDVLSQLHADNGLLGQLWFHGSQFLARLSADTRKPVMQNEINSATSTASTMAPPSFAPPLLLISSHIEKQMHGYLIQQHPAMHGYSALQHPAMRSCPMPGQAVNVPLRRCVSR